MPAFGLAVVTRFYDLCTIFLPSGARLAPASLRCAQANGGPMMVMVMVMVSARPSNTWMIASHQPASTNQTMLPSVLSAPHQDEIASHGRRAAAYRARCGARRTTKVGDDGDSHQSGRDEPGARGWETAAYESKDIEQ